MKKLIGLVVILAALILCSYYGMGLITERTIERNVDVINQSNGLYVDVSNYKRGWFTSTAVLNWRLHIPERVTKDQNGQTITTPAQDFTVEMPLTIHHGPIIVADSTVKFGLGYARSDVAMPQAYIEKFSTLFTNESTKPRLNLSLFVNYLNSCRINVDLPAFNLVSKQSGDLFKWDGMNIHVKVSSSIRNIDGGLTIDGISLTRDKMKATLGKLTSDYTLHQTDTGIYLGDASLSVPSFVVTDSDQKILDVEQFAIHSSSDITNGLFNSDFSTSLNKMVAHNKTYGPAVLEMSIKNLDAQVLTEINSQANKLQQGTESERQQALLTILPQLPKLFNKGAQFEVSKFSVVVPEGTINGNLLVSLPKGDITNPFQLMQKVVGHGKLEMPAAVLKELMTASAKQKILSQPTLQQAMLQQMKKNDSAPEPSGATPNNQVPASDTANKQVPASEASNNQAQVNETPNDQTQGSQDQKPLTAAEVEQQAAAQADQKLSAMVQAGLIVLQGTEYVIEVNLAQGQLSVNGKPFTPAMMQF